MVSGLLLLTCALFRLAFAAAPCFPLNLASNSNSSVHSSIGTPSSWYIYRLRLFVDIRFQVLFHSPPGVLFTFPSRYYALSVDISILAWRVVPPASHKVSRVSWYSGYSPMYARFRLQGFHLLRLSFPARFFYLIYTWWLSSTPVRLPAPVWPLSRSLAATKKISFDYSSSG